MTKRRSTTKVDIPNREPFLNDFARRAFRDIADHDYIAARLAYRHRLGDQFLWSAQQAIEKYLKAILLFNRIKAPRVKHDLDKALKKLEEGLPFKLRLSDVSRKFLAHLDRYGRYRYFETSPYVREDHLHQLDLLVWELRRYCTLLNYTLQANGKSIPMLEHELQKIERSETRAPHLLSIMDGELEKILKKRKSPTRAALVYMNFRFGARSRQTITMRPMAIAKNSPLLLHPEILDELDEYVYLSDPVFEAYAPLRDEALRRIQDALSKRDASTPPASGTVEI